MIGRVLDLMFRRTAPDDERNGKARQIVQVKREADRAKNRIRRLLEDVADEYAELDVRR